MLDLAAEMQRRCPDAWLINYTNPSGIIAEALGKHSRVNFVSLCSGPAGWSRAIFSAWAWTRARQRRVGRAQPPGVCHPGVGRWQRQRPSRPSKPWRRTGVDGDVIRTLGAIPASYLRYFYHHDLALAEMREPGYRTRGR